MHDLSSRIADVLLEVEATLRINGKWETTRPDAAALSSKQPFSIDTLSFVQWLQWKFLPQMKETLENTRPMPLSSSIHVYAQDSLDKDDPATGNLMVLVKRFDDLISLHSGRRCH